MNSLKLLILFTCTLSVLFVKSQSQPLPGTTVRVESPRKNLVALFYQTSNDKGENTMYYTVAYKGLAVIAPSVLDIRIDNRLSESAMAVKVDTLAKWTANLVVKGIDTYSRDSSWKPVCGERSVIRDRYNAAIVQMVKNDNAAYRMNIELRVYDEGVAFRYFFPENEKGIYYRIKAENTEFTLPEGTTAFHALWAQAKYQELPLKDWPEEAERPLTLRLPNGLYTCLAEAAMVDYARTKFKLSPDKKNTILTSMYTPADLISPVGTPWRVIMVAEKAGDLIEQNSIILNLNEPARIPDPGWIKPGKIIRVMTQTTADAIENIDFARRHNLQYILFDWKWYGPAFSFSSDATRVAIPDFDLPHIIQYGKEKGIGVWLYVNMQGLYAQSDSLFDTYKGWGVKGVKFGFVQVGSHRWTTWLESMFKKAAQSGLMVNVHDDWRPTGEQRSWPNLMTAEGVRGNEEMPDATHNTILPFTRYIAGPADYTICYYDRRIKTTHAHQLALAAIYYSPIQTLFWYDKPAMYAGEPELEFWKQIPTVWDDTKVIGGEPGKYIATARRSGGDWFIGAITNTDARNLKLPLSFLERGKAYTATIYADDSTVATKTHVRVKTMPVTVATVLDVQLMASGGEAIWIKQVGPQ